MAKMGLIGVVLIYLLGVLSVAAGSLSSEWNSDWSFDDQLFDALEMGARWPLLVIDQIVGV